MTNEEVCLWFTDTNISKILLFELAITDKCAVYTFTYKDVFVFMSESKKFKFEKKKEKKVEAWISPNRAKYS